MSPVRESVLVVATHHVSVHAAVIAVAFSDWLRSVKVPHQLSEHPLMDPSVACETCGRDLCRILTGCMD